ncbi:hypothetical protein [Leptolyngbya sp. FACHB-36]|uniref:hypothetical protein n=1 Tax=Leptolyngbya sp. FACHB-36 TaxID=2692808 RepID=UPI001F54E9EE|nr:hypothetical protein [Leptolyngbya sp. FACHB-36]
MGAVICWVAATVAPLLAILGAGGGGTGGIRGGGGGELSGRWGSVITLLLYTSSERQKKDDWKGWNDCATENNDCQTVQLSGKIQLHSCQLGGSPAGAARGNQH